MVALLVGILLLLGAMVWDDRLAERQNRLAADIADRQDRLAREQSERAEILENIRFVRQIAIDGGRAKPFQDFDLSSAVLADLELGCEDLAAKRGCAQFQNAKLNDTLMMGADLRGANFLLADLTEASLGHSDLEAAYFFSANLVKADLIKARLRHADLSMASLYGARLAYADLSGANLYALNLTQADLSFATLNGASLQAADLSGAVLVESSLRGADLSEAKHLTQSQLDDAVGDTTTRIPVGLRRPATWDGRPTSPTPYCPPTPDQPRC